MNTKRRMRFILQIAVVSLLTQSCKDRTFHSHVSQVETQVSPIETEVEFAANKESFFIVGVNKDITQTSCSEVSAYSSLIAARNSLPKPAECLIEEIPDTLKSQLVYPAYSYGREKFWSTYLDKVKWYANISDIIPRELWNRFREQKAYNSVCYNSSLVGAGIFPISGLSMFEPPVDILLGFLRPRVTKASNGSYQLSMVRETETNALVTKRKSWEVNKNEIGKYFDIISSEIAKGFSPANVMCISIGTMEKSGSFLLKMKEQLPGSRIVESPDEIIERAGGHCLNFLTPSLIMEANKELPHNFTNWRRAFNNYATIGGKEPTVFHFIQFNDDKLIDWSRRENALSNQKFARLLKITSDFRNFHENISLSPDTLELPYIDFQNY